MPLSPHPDDEKAGKKLSIRNLRKLFANIINNDFHFSYTTPLLMPQFVDGPDKTVWLQQMHATLTGQFSQHERFKQSHPNIGHLWDAPLYPLVDHNPILTLLALARYLDIELDFGLCAAQQFCKSFQIASNAIAAGIINRATIPLQVANLNFAVPLHPMFGDRIGHTHALAAVGQRKAEGGRECHLCGLWETSPAPAIFCDGEEIEDLAGIKTGSGIGRGRYSVGNLCPDCIEMSTCAECGVFVCHNCEHPPAGVLNPLIAMDDAGIMICCKGVGHLPECNECGTSRGDLYFECHECQIQYCLRCEPPTGKVVVADAWGGDVDIDPDLWVCYGKRSLYSEKELSGLVGFTPELDPLDDNAFSTFVEMDMFESCVSCSTSMCAKCISRTNLRAETHSFFASKPNACQWKYCHTGCGSVYCTECNEDWLDPCCKQCKGRYMCTNCDTEDVPAYVHGCLEAGGETRWCPRKDCMLDSGILDFSDLRGPWEFGYVAPAPSSMWHGPNPVLTLARLQQLYGPDTRLALEDMLKLTKPRRNQSTPAPGWWSIGYDPPRLTNSGHPSTLQSGTLLSSAVGYQPGLAGGNLLTGGLRGNQAGPTPGYHNLATSGHQPGLVSGNLHSAGPPIPTSRLAPGYHQGPVLGHQAAPGYGHQQASNGGQQPALVTGNHPGPASGNTPSAPPSGGLLPGTIPGPPPGPGGAGGGGQQQQP
jgi:hypothetical protein